MSDKDTHESDKPTKPSATGGVPAKADRTGDKAGTGTGGSGDSGPRARPMALAALAVAIVAVIGAAVGGWWLWQRIEVLRGSSGDYVAQGAFEQRAGELDSQLDQQTSALGERLDGLDARLSNLNQQIGGRGDAMAELRQQIQSLNQTQQSLGQRMDRVQELARTSKDDWKRSEASYLVAVAIHRLRYYQDVDAALAALKEADTLLSDFGGDAIKARKGIARAIDRLIDVDPPRIQRVLNQLQAMGEQVGTLPVAGGPEKRIGGSGDGQGAQMQGDTWKARARNAWAQFTGSLGELVTVSSAQEVAPLRTPEQRFFLKQNLKLQLEAARLAALRGDQSIYKDSIARLRDWLTTYFDPSEPAVSKLLEKVDRMADARVSVSMPDIAPLLAPAREFE